MTTEHKSSNTEDSEKARLTMREELAQMGITGIVSEPYSETELETPKLFLFEAWEAITMAQIDNDIIYEAKQEIEKLETEGVRLPTLKEAIATLDGFYSDMKNGYPNPLDYASEAAHRFHLVRNASGNPRNIEALKERLNKYVLI